MMEIQLRVVLLGVGLVILLIVAFDYFKNKPARVDIVDQNADPASKRVRPKIKAAPSIDAYKEPTDIYEAVTLSSDQAAAVATDVRPDLSQEPRMASQESGAYAQTVDLGADQDEEDVPHIITVSIMARDKYGFHGAELIEALEAAQLEFGKNDLFHRFEDDQIVFTVANAVEPGYFIIETLADEHVPGITLILLPEKIAHPALAFDKLIRAAKQIAFAVNGELLDHFRQPLTLATIEQYRKETEAITKRR